MKTLFIWKRPVNNPLLFWLVDHSFATTRDDFISESQVNDTTEYWYCHAEQFSATLTLHDPNVQGMATGDVDHRFARCLTEPNIKAGEPTHDPLVASGKYLVHWVCHQLTNRVLAAKDGCPTISDYTGLNVRGYYLSIQRYGPYGRNVTEWLSRMQGCAKRKGAEVTPMKTREDELDHVMEVFAEGSALSAFTLDSLHRLNQSHQRMLDAFYEDMEAGRISEEEMEIGIARLELAQIQQTQQMIGPQQTARLHGMTADEAEAHFLRVFQQLQL